MVPLLLSGPAGSGKTYRCLAEIAELLQREPEGPTLLMVAPRQATYQLERQILGMGVDGFTRLRIVSFQRLAQFVFEAAGQVEPKLLDEQGRVMALRAILARKREGLRIYRQAALHEALAQELSDFWREACEQNVSPESMRRAAKTLAPNSRLRAKLEDFADVFDAYREWLTAQGLRDGDKLLEIAAETARAATMPEIGGLWLDGFAQMTPQERRLLRAILEKCAHATLAFCLPERPMKEGSPFSMWSVVTRTYCQLRDELPTRPREEILPRRTGNGRFRSEAIAHLEANWQTANTFAPNFEDVRIVKCRDVEAEAIFIAREILKFVRGGGRFREAAVLVRSLEGADETVRRIFKRYRIPCFIDRRQAVAHHPLAELTRGAVRFIAFGGEMHDLFCALKSGLSGLLPVEVDWFENMALARGWQGEAWRKPLACGAKAELEEVKRANRIAQQALGPIWDLQSGLEGNPTGREVAAALQEFWKTLRVEEQLEAWAREAREMLHTGVWTQMDEWLKTLELAFAGERNSISEWLTIIEAGLQSLTVGLIPPALDQTMIGAVDRSRNPDLRAVFVMGVNEGIFPRPAKERLLLNDTERELLNECGLRLAATSAWNLGAEQFYGYIACTRAREKLTLTYSEMGLDGEPLNPSIFISQIQRLFPGLKEQCFSEWSITDCEAEHEVNATIFSAVRRGGALTKFERELESWQRLAPMWERARTSAETALAPLSPERIAALYGKRIRTSVSKLEQFAMCPFRFYVASGLKAEERALFELDKREEGRFQHEVLMEFHLRLEANGQRWRDIDPKAGRALIAEIGAAMKEKFSDGLADATPSNRFKAEAKLAALGEFMEQYLRLLRECVFDPRKVEFAFGGKDARHPAWVVQIDDERALEFTGRIDRVDIWLDESGRGRAIVYDYKSSKKELDRTLVEHAIQQQLPAYLAALKTMGKTAEFPFEIHPAGAFYVSLGMRVTAAKDRAEAIDGENKEFKQRGIFDWSLKPQLDPKDHGELFDYSSRGPSDAAVMKAMHTQDFERLLNETVERLRRLGKKIFDGDLTRMPFKKGQLHACGTCFYAGICRFDPWTHPYNEL